MVKALVVVGALLLAGLPAALGLVGNDSFTRDQPVRIPDQPSPTRGHGDEAHGDEGPDGEGPDDDDRRNRHDGRDRGHTGRDG